MDSDSDSDDSNGGGVDDGASDISGGEDSSESSDDEVTDDEEQFISDLQRIRDNDPYIIKLDGDSEYEFIQNITNEQWEEIGRDISNNTHLEEIRLCEGALNDERMSHLFRGLTRSSSVQCLRLDRNGLNAAEMRSMVPILQRSNNLRELDLDGNNIQTEGFNVLCRALRDSPIEKLHCCECGIESIGIDNDHSFRHLKELNLSSNNISTDGCREIAKLLQGGDATLEDLNLIQNQIDDEGVAILVDALRSNTSLTTLMLIENENISWKGPVMLLKLVNDISSIKATLQSNHTLMNIFVLHDKEIERHIDMATVINRRFGSNPEAAGREKMIRTQLHSAKRVELARLQGVNQSVSSEINPLHLPEVLSLVGRRHGQEELYIALKSSIAGVISVVNRRQCIMQKLAYHEAKSTELRAELAELDASDGNEACRNKRHRIL